MALWALWNTVLWCSKERWARAVRPRLRPRLQARRSRLYPLPRPAVLRQLVIRVVVRDSVMPRMVGRLAGRSQRLARQCRPPWWPHRWRGHCPQRRGNFRPPHPAIAIADVDLAGRVFTHLDGAARRRLLTLSLQLQQPIGIAHDPVIRDGARLLEAKDRLQGQPAWDRDVKVVGRRRGAREAAIMIGPVRRLEKRIGRRHVRDPVPAQLLLQAILVRAVMALDPPLPLRGAPRNDGDTQLRAHPAKLGQRRGTRGALLLIRPTHIHVFPVRIQRARNAVPLNPRAQHPDGGPDRLLRAEPADAPACRIVDHRQQATRRPPLLQPRMHAAIELHQLAKVHHALPPPPMRTALPRATPQTGRQHPPPQRVVMHLQAVLTRQVLRRQRRPEPLADRAAVFLGSAPGCGRARPRPAPHSSHGPRCDASTLSRHRPGTGDTTVSPGDSSSPSPPLLTPTSTSPLPPAPTRPPASALAYSSLSAPICDLRSPA